MKRIDEIQDNEIRVISRSQAPAVRKKRWWIYLLAGLLALAVACGALLLWRLKSRETPVQDVFDPGVPSTATPIQPYRGPISPLSADADTVPGSYTEHIKKVVNDIQLDIYIPHRATPKLIVGTPDIFDKRIILVTQAADIRADNSRINGAFVLEGKPLAWGLSRKGYVSIINGQITIGKADNSPLFEEATETGGYFFRQFALVDNGIPVENEPKNKAIRKAICQRGGEIFVAMTQERESMHDFSQALADLGVDNAVYLVGADSYGFWRDRYDHFTQFNEKRSGGYKYENYIVWER